MEQLAKVYIDVPPVPVPTKRTVRTSRPLVLANGADAVEETVEEFDLQASSVEVGESAAGMFSIRSVKQFSASTTEAARIALETYNWLKANTGGKDA